MSGVMAAADLAEALEDELYAIRLQLGSTTFPKTGSRLPQRLGDPDKGWLRKFYKQERTRPSSISRPQPRKPSPGWFSFRTPV